MILRDKIRQVLVDHYGQFKSVLEHQYETKLTENLIEGSIEDKKAWLTYNQVVLELKNTLNDKLRVEELQYKLTDDINPNDVCMEVIEGVKHRSTELDRLYYKIRNF